MPRLLPCASIEEGRPSRFMFPLSGKAKCEERPWAGLNHVSSALQYNECQNYKAEGENNHAPLIDCGYRGGRGRLTGIDLDLILISANRSVIVELDNQSIIVLGRGLFLDFYRFTSEYHL